jgi:hypothetical protein
MILKEHCDLTTMLFICQAVEEEDDLDAKSCTDCQEGRDEDLVRVTVLGSVRDDGADGFNAYNEIDGSHAVSIISLSEEFIVKQSRDVRRAVSDVPYGG